MEIHNDMHSFRIIVKEDFHLYDEAMMDVFILAKKGRERMIYDGTQHKFVEYQPFAMQNIRSMSVPREFLYALASAIAESGFLPKEMVERGGEMSALKEHLNDMRAIAFREIKEVPHKPRI